MKKKNIESTTGRDKLTGNKITPEPEQPIETPWETVERKDVWCLSGVIYESNKYDSVWAVVQDKYTNGYAVAFNLPGTEGVKIVNILTESQIKEGILLYRNDKEVSVLNQRYHWDLDQPIMARKKGSSDLFLSIKAGSYSWVMLLDSSHYPLESGSLENCFHRALRWGYTISNFETAPVSPGIKLQFYCESETTHEPVPEPEEEDGIVLLERRKKEIREELTTQVGSCSCYFSKRNIMIFECLLHQLNRELEVISDKIIKEAGRE